MIPDFLLGCALEMREPQCVTDCTREYRSHRSRAKSNVPVCKGLVPRTKLPVDELPACVEVERIDACRWSFALGLVVRLADIDHAVPRATRLPSPPFVCSTSFVRCGLQLYNAVVMASTTSVPPKLRGKIAGFMSAGVGLGGFLGPFALSIAFAWSISTSSPAGETPLVNQHFAFNVGALIRALLLMLLWKDLTEENLTDVVDDVPGLESFPLELESIHEDRSTESPGNLALGDRRVNLV